MDLVQRVKNICLTPNTEWPVIADETTAAGSLIAGYVVPLAAVGAVAGLIGGSLVGYTVPFVGTYRTPIVAGLVTAVIGLVMAVVGILIISFIINALAPTFGAQQNGGQALKVAVYSFTPAWVAGVLRIVPALGLLGVLAALYGIYLLYLGLPRLMKCPPEKALPYTAVSVVSAFIVTLVVGAVVGLVGGVGMMGAGMLGGASRPPAAAAQFDPDSPLGKLQALSNKLEESGKKMDAAQKSGNAKDQAAAAAETIGTLLGGGSRVEPVEIGQLKPLLPDTFGGLARQSSSAEKNGIAGLMVSKAEAEYGDGAGKRIQSNLRHGRRQRSHVVRELGRRAERKGRPVRDGEDREGGRPARARESVEDRRQQRVRHRARRPLRRQRHGRRRRHQRAEDGGLRPGPRQDRVDEERRRPE